jgi:hypothetical protein
VEIGDVHQAELARDPVEGPVVERRQLLAVVQDVGDIVAASRVVAAGELDHRGGCVDADDTARPRVGQCTRGQPLATRQVEHLGAP